MNIECSDLITEFAILGFSLLRVGKTNENGPDMWVKRKDGKPVSVEIKKVRRLKSGSLQVRPVERLRMSDDLIAIKINAEYWLIEPMKDHLKCCTTKGYRSLNMLRP